MGNGWISKSCFKNQFLQHGFGTALQEIGNHMDDVELWW